MNTKLTLKQYLDGFYKNKDTVNLEVENYCTEKIDNVIEFIDGNYGRKLIIAKPAMGKSTMVLEIAKTRKVLFLAPTKGIATQMADDFCKMTKGTYSTLLCSKVDNYIVNVDNKSNIVIAVYDSLSKIDYLGIDISDYTIFLDEVHQTILATTYRQSAIDKMNEIIGENYVALTGTPYSLPLNTYKTLHIYRSKESEKNIIFYKKSKNINTNEYIRCISKTIKGKVVILCNNSNSAKDLKIVLEDKDIGRKVIIVDSNENTKTRDTVVKSKKFPHGIDTIITTEAMSDGVSLLDEDITDMILMKQNINLNHLIQFPARARRSNPIVHYILAENRGKNESERMDINFNMESDSDVSRIRMKADLCNISLTPKQLKELFKHNRKFNRYIENGEKYTINDNLLAVDFFTREDKLVNSVVIELFEYYDYTVSFIDSIKKLEKTESEQKNKVAKFKDISTNDKVSLVMGVLSNTNIPLTDKTLNKSNYKKQITSTINKVKKILDVEDINHMEALAMTEIIELSVDLPDNFNKMADIKRALDSMWGVDLAYTNTIKELISNKGRVVVGGKEYVFIRDGKYVSKEEQKVIENEFSWLYQDKIKGKFDYDTFMKCIYKIDRNEKSELKENFVTGILNTSELYLQQRIIKLA